MKAILLLLLPVVSFSQNIFSGKIIDKKTGLVIPFATVALLIENIGTNADEVGAFKLASLRNLEDTISISCVGYQTAKVAVSGIPADKRFQLEAKSIMLQQIIVRKNFSPISELLNQFSDCGTSFYTTRGFDDQIAMKFQNPQRFSLLSQINICKDGKNAFFRLRVYNIDSVTNEPGLDLLDTILEVKTKKRYIQVNVEKFNIIIPERDFFIAIEWLKIPYNEQMVHSTYNGKKMEYLQYNPLVSFVKKDAINDAEKKSSAWHKSYTGKWQRMDEFVSSFLISAKVKY